MTKDWLPGQLRVHHPSTSNFLRASLRCWVKTTERNRFWAGQPGQCCAQLVPIFPLASFSNVPSLHIIGALGLAETRCISCVERSRQHRWEGFGMSRYHIAQINIGRVLASLEDPIMEGFVSRLDELNAVADRSPGFVWRLQTPAGNATYLRPYEGDDRLLMNMSVWESIEALKSFVYRTPHKEMLRQREEWFEK